MSKAQKKTTEVKEEPIPKAPEVIETFTLQTFLAGEGKKYNPGLVASLKYELKDSVKKDRTLTEWHKLFEKQKNRRY